MGLKLLEIKLDWKLKVLLGWLGKFKKKMVGDIFYFVKERVTMIIKEKDDHLNL